MLMTMFIFLLIFDFYRLYETIIPCVSRQYITTSCDKNNMKWGLEGMDTGIDYMCKQNKQGTYLSTHSKP